MSEKVVPSPKEASAIPSAMVLSESKRVKENDSTRNKRPQNMVKIGAPPLRMVPNETVRSLRAMLEKPISRAVVMPMGRTYSRNCFRVREGGRYFRCRESKKAQSVVTVFEKEVTVNG